jgi:hypothetical protein
MSSLLITVLVGVCTFLWYSRFRHVVRWWKRVPTLRDRGFDFAELDLPSGWRPAEDLNGSAGIEAVDLLHSRYAVVISECIDDFDARLDLASYAAGARNSLTSSLHVLNVRGPEHRTISGFDAIQYEIEGVHEMTEVWYLHTTIKGRRAFHQVIGWAPRSAYKRKVFDEILAGFRERSGPAAEPRVYKTQVAESDTRAIGFRPSGLRRAATSESARRNGEGQRPKS